MSPRTTDEASPSERVKALELKAQAITSRLLDAVDALDRRRLQAMEVGRYAKGVARPALMTALGVIVVVGAFALTVGASLRARRARSLRGRARSALQRLDLAPKPPSMMLRLFEKAALSIVTIAANAMFKRLTLPEAHGGRP